MEIDSASLLKIIGEKEVRLHVLMEQMGLMQKKLRELEQELLDSAKAASAGPREGE